MKLFFYIILLLSGVSNTQAHNKSESSSVWHLKKNNLHGIITIPAKEATRIPYSKEETDNLGKRFSSYLVSHIIIRSQKEDCPVSSEPRILRSSSTFIRVELTYTCRDSAPDLLIYTGLFEYAPSHLHYSRLYFENGNLSENLFQSKRTEWDLNQGSSQTDQPISGFLQFVIAGIEHIGSGLDHIAFLLAILFVSKTGKDVLLSITGFTLGHSLTLSVSVLSKISPSSLGIEAFIGLTIWIVAAEYVCEKEPSNRKKISLILALVALSIGFVSWKLGTRESHIFLAYIGMSFFTFCYLSLKPYIPTSNGKVIYLGISTAAFGMIHGFGFAGFLLEAGLDKEHLFAPLFGFNLGVELGQLILVGIVFLFLWIRGQIRYLKQNEKQEKILSLSFLFILSSLGAYWFIQRSF
ncbi:HupE/UreJ family protein [Leptospira sarikeiensis]|uniref:HupE/UreJ family protein n=1 Tax=Leptospira sarikeiensis TaxID=2484943 RepID=A0A4R9KBU7_9LEPT|nr:HupE/UreJ family protein [Leptospira sarikeiensis]TGL64248.1 HupE/UreJ family protein [Leptospira sarikeiensis]